MTGGAQDSGAVSDAVIEAMAKAHCDFFGGEGWWDTGLIVDTRPKALEAMRAVVAAMPRATPAPAGWQYETTDWRAVAKAAGNNGIRFRTNRALIAFLNEIRAIPTAPAEGGV